MFANKIQLFFLLFFGIANAVKVPITIYYESLCPDSAKFINEQVFPAVKSDLRDYVDITWVPFGKSQFSTQGSDVMFNCHHGPNECYGNKIHACAIDHIQANSYQTEFTRESLTLDFINCMMRQGKNLQDNTGAKCARDNNINTWENIHQCANSTEGSQLLKQHGETTNHFQMPLLGVPTVVFKQQYDSNVNEQAMHDFRSTVCQYISQPKPKICLGNGAMGKSVSIFMGMFAVLITLKNFF